MAFNIVTIPAGSRQVSVSFNAGPAIDSTCRFDIYDPATKSWTAVPGAGFVVPAGQFVLTNPPAAMSKWVLQWTFNLLNVSEDNSGGWEVLINFFADGNFIPGSRQDKRGPFTTNPYAYTGNIMFA